MIDWHQLVSERNEWVAHNFPDSEVGVAHTVMGLMEEAGELAHAHLKEAQSIRGTAEEHQMDAMDAIGDLTVYLLGVLKRVGSSLSPRPPFAMLDRDTDEALLHIGTMVGQICRDAASRHTLMSLRTAEVLVFHMRQYCSLRGWDYDQIVEGTWTKVKKRDWIKYPDTGLPPSGPVNSATPAHFDPA